MIAFNSKTGLKYKLEKDKMENKYRTAGDKIARALKPGVRLYKQMEGFQTGRLTPDEFEILQSVEVGGKLVIKPNPKHNESKVAAWLTVYTKDEVVERQKAYENAKNGISTTDAADTGSSF